MPKIGRFEKKIFFQGAFFGESGSLKFIWFISNERSDRRAEMTVKNTLKMNQMNIDEEVLFNGFRKRMK
jgi:hypothetical protein